MRPLPRGLRSLPVTPLSRGPTVDMISADDVALILDGGDLQDWCSKHDALYVEVDPKSFALDVTAAFALGRGFSRCVFRR